MEWVCDCMDLPYAQCIDGTCSPSYCIEDNPTGCFETGCNEGYECIVTDGINECTPSSCFCDESAGFDCDRCVCVTRLRRDLGESC